MHQPLASIRKMEKIIDKYLNRLISIELNKLPQDIEPEMSDPNQDQNEEWIIWFPVPSKVKDEEIIEFESRLGYRLPESYKRFLKFKHFYELQISECSFCEHPVNTWRYSLSEMVFDGYPRELLIDKGRIPFANWSDWGLLCFDTTKEFENQDYPIVLWDHEISDEFEPRYSDFESMIYKLDKEVNAS
ncbi:SMI1/KNR4 family protein [Catalinimonas niigatensis]|uniref:SMI1/KNR4 family protein n=1 Tax=Catalinimonas niigatensis TaxID=1397264 RepID=UPI002665C83D|nr:SMI1/KNR4 family protein [Catalinimonas niigatensis]WPP49649.1 SMI1/KNR4 family protein [Catalinimonas niigatensis]